MGEDSGTWRNEMDAAAQALSDRLTALEREVATLRKQRDELIRDLPKWIAWGVPRAKPQRT